MADIITLEERLRRQKEKQLTQEKARKLDSLRTVMQCTACHLKCAKCGSQLETPQPRILTPQCTLRLCPDCWEEFNLYRKIHSGNPEAEGREYYHNQAWLDLWRSWLEYQERLSAYRNSEEFLKLLSELTKDKE